MKLIWYFVALVSGAFLPIQAGLNSKLGKSIENPVYASMISFAIGFFSLLAFILLTKQSVTWAGVKSVPVYVWASGVLGAFYVTAVILTYPQIGPALTFGLVVAGQMIISVLMDHFHILVHIKHSINIYRLIGVAFIVAGVIIIRKF
ncbi:DMT family transporter [Lacibacter sediminis]|uniref:DMT family transporter n=1 Tax=Lacibacter sediminis TaxID=2760713 RepID=A0A7G5XKB7_9BACT|nr:DMT family transporter [Lacibacter sediminis]QNA45920.1 DMT family transporter [Lacibacter sediminis]